MAYDSKIQWTEATWNPWHGCKKVSPGCKYCYMYRDKERWNQDPTTVIRSKSGFNAPLKWNESKLIFTCSWSDWFIEEADEWRDDAWKVIRDTPQHTYQILTKRPDRIVECLPCDWGNGYPNVWLGVSVESEAQLGRINSLIQVPSVVRFISFEPLIGEIDLHYPEGINDPDSIELGVVQNPPFWFYMSKNIHWAIIGGESGNENGKYKYRECKDRWIRSLIGDLQAAHIPVFVKQLGTSLSKELALKDRHGGNMDEWPEEFRIRQMPYTNATTI